MAEKAIQLMTDDELRAVFFDIRSFHEQGVIGEGPLRELSKKISEQNNNPSDPDGALSLLLVEHMVMYEIACRAMQEENHWKRVAAYLASCHAATAEYDGSLKSTSKSRLKRMKSICTIAADMLEGKAIDKSLTWVTVQKEAERCRRAAL